MMNIEQARAELLRHSFDNFVDEPPSIAEGGRSVVVVGCPACRKRMQTINQFMHHIADDVLPGIFRMREVGEEG